MPQGRESSIFREWYFTTFCDAAHKTGGFSYERRWNFCSIIAQLYVQNVVQIALENVVEGFIYEQLSKQWFNKKISSKGSKVLSGKFLIIIEKYFSL